MTRDEQVQMDKLEAEVIRLRYANAKLVEVTKAVNSPRATTRRRRERDRKIAALVLRKAINSNLDGIEQREYMEELANAYAAGEREVPDERLLKDLALRARRIAELEFQIAAHPAAIAAAKRETAARCAAIASEVSASYDKEDGFPSHHAVGAETVAVTIIAKFGLVRKVKP